MANDDHVAMLKKGVDAWNEWRLKNRWDRAHPSRWPNLSKADLSGENLTRAFLARASLVKAYLGGANLSGADLSEANLNEAYLAKANLACDCLLAAEPVVAPMDSVPRPAPYQSARMLRVSANFRALRSAGNLTEHSL